MAEEKDNDLDWSEIDLNSPVEEKVDFEVEEENVETKSTTSDDATELEDVIDDPSSDDELPASTDTVEETIPELDGINTKGAQKRIRQLVKQRKEREDTIAQMQEELASLRQKSTKATEDNFTYNNALFAVQEKELNQKTEFARSKYKEAYNSGDQDALLSAQEDLADAKADLKILEQQKNWVAQQAKEYENQKQIDAQNQNADFDPKAHAWASRNPWFGQDKTATAVALSIDQDLKERGFDPSSDNYYTEVDRRIQEELPHKFKSKEVEQPETESAVPSRPQRVVAGQSRTPSPKKVKLTQDDVALAKKWNIPLETYAAQKAKAEKADGEYTAVL